MKVRVDPRSDPRHDVLHGTERIAKINLAEAYEIVETMRAAGKKGLASRLELLFHLDGVVGPPDS